MDGLTEEDAMNPRNELGIGGRRTGKSPTRNVCCPERRCTACGKKPQHYYHRCYECFTEWNRKDKARKDQRRRERIKRLEVHTRICISCRKQFASQKGWNVCLPCNQAVLTAAAKHTLDQRPITRLTRNHVHVILGKNLGWRVGASATPRIPLWQADVFQSPGARR